MTEKIISSRRLGAVVFITAFISYAGTVGFGYVWDDTYLVDRVREALSSGDIWGLFTKSFYVKVFSTARYYRPVMFASLLGERILTGGVPWFSHLTNVLIHAFNATLIFALFRKILKEDRGALVGALLFAAHPVHSGTVAAVYNRMDLLSLALLLPLILHWTVTEDNGQRNGIGYCVLSCLLFFLACLTKETAFMVPFVLLGWMVVRSGRPGRQQLTVMAGSVVAVSAAVFLRTMVFSREVPDTAIQGIRAGTLMPEISLTQVLKVLMVNIQMFVLPFPGRTHWAASDFHPGWTTALAGTIFLLLLVLGFRVNNRTTGKALIWWSAFTLPVSGIFYIGPVIATERYVYIPSVGLCLIFGGIISSLSERMRGRYTFKTLVLAGTILLCFGSVTKSRDWKDGVSIFREVTRTNPTFVNGYLNLGAALAREGKLEEALQVYGEGLDVEPGKLDLTFNRGNLLYRMGKFEEALADYNTVLQKTPDDWEASLNRGNVLVAMGRGEEAARSFRDALAINGSSGKAFVGLGVLAARDGDFNRAVQLFQEAVKNEPSLTQAYEGLAESYLALGMSGMAEGALLKALEVSPDNAGAALKLGWFFLETGRPVQAENTFRKVLAADPQNLEALVGIVRSLDASGMDRDADELIQDLIHSDPALAGKVLESREKGAVPLKSR